MPTLFLYIAVRTMVLTYLTLDTIALSGLSNHTGWILIAPDWHNFRQFVMPAGVKAGIQTRLTVLFKKDLIEEYWKK